jgi:hypothetical protein
MRTVREVRAGLAKAAAKLRTDAALAYAVSELMNIAEAQEAEIAKLNAILAKRSRRPQRQKVAT